MSRLDSVHGLYGLANAWRVGQAPWDRKQYAGAHPELARTTSSSSPPHPGLPTHQPQLAAIPTIGLLSGFPPIDPKNGALKLKMPPSEATNQ